MSPSDIAEPGGEGSDYPPSRKETEVLTSERVEDVTRTCLNGSAEPPAILVEGILARFAFDPARIEANRQAIVEMVTELPDEFLTKGGGWSFLNLCVDRHGRQWTGLHQDQEALCCLAIAAGVGQWLFPRELWGALPGGMPYVRFDHAAGVP